MYKKGDSNYIYFFLQENEETISVYKRSLRTTSALESYNSKLGKKIAAKGNFFKFVGAIIEEELVVGRDLSRMIETGGAVKPSRKLKYKDRDAMITTATQDLESEKITTMEFLNRITYEEHDNLLKNISLFLPEGYLSANEHSDSDEDGSTSSQSTAGSQYNPNEGDGMCVVCKISRWNMCFLPCTHIRCCKNCTERLHADALPQQPKCPICRQTVAKSFSVIV